MLTVRKCRACGRNIVFIRTESGKAMPCDYAAIAYTPLHDGPDVFYTADGKQHRGRVSTPVIGANIGYRPHWATCPAAGRFKAAQRLVKNQRAQKAAAAMEPAPLAEYEQMQMEG